MPEQPSPRGQNRPARPAPARARAPSGAGRLGAGAGALLRGVLLRGLAGLAALCWALLGAPLVSPALAQQDWFRPPADVGSSSAPARQPTRPPAQSQGQPRQAARPAPQRSAPPPQQEQRWRPLFPFFGLFEPAPPDGDAARRAPRELPPATDEPARPRVAKPAPEGPAEPRGAVYGSLEAARKDAEKQITASVLVLGDQYAGTLAQGLADMFAPDRSTIAVIGNEQDGSGLLPGGFDWLAAAPDLARAEQPTAIVVMIGQNDLRPLDGAGDDSRVLDERWREVYGRRLDDFLMRLKATGRPVAVVGLAPQRDSRASELNSRFNALLEERTARAGLTYIDVWDGFVDENGKYLVSGPAVDGQRRRLRTADGVGFTRSGGRKLGFFVDRAIGKLLGGEGAPAAGLPLPAASPAGPPAIIQLTGAGTGAKELAGGPGAAPAPAPEGSAALAMRTLKQGDPLPLVAGRADDFRWPAANAAAPPSPGVAAPAEGAAPAGASGPATGGTGSTAATGGAAITGGAASPPSPAVPPSPAAVSPSSPSSPPPGASPAAAPSAAPAGPKAALDPAGRLSAAPASVAGPPAGATSPASAAASPGVAAPAAPGPTALVSPPAADDLIAPVPVPPAFQRAPERRTASGGTIPLTAPSAGTGTAP
ncbi:SGNH/GDSL hydrolase family protein [Ancylobacter lacus]|uniref:SGNH/GDSL hydrolase family protein n=1 Tax=Ancylobacter lacus TaxID=2579970 RepID=UPI001BD1A3B9|nr:GDSL-type esterase/lipase family protein [Ancylobacter lacus]MBS7541145.1 DUF459 domain-containing protein [Ancylobacter lacus]